MKSEEKQYEIDIKNNKVKEGFLIKRSRILKQWKERWMVLTKTHLYSFVEKQVYKKPTEKIPLKDVSTIKSYYKNQYNRTQIIRVESSDADFYLSAKNHQQKWAWMTAIEKMTDLAVCPQQENSSSHNLIRESIRMSTAIRKTFTQNLEKKQTQIPKDMMKKLGLAITPMADVKILPIIAQIQEEQQRLSKQRTSSVDIQKEYEEKLQKVNKQLQIKQQLLTEALKSVEKNSKPPEPKQRIVEKVIEKEVEKEVEKIVYVPEVKEKIVYVTEIKEVIKTVYKDDPEGGIVGNSVGSTYSMTLLKFFEDVMNLKCENPKPLIEFVVFLTFAEVEKYSELILSFATSERVQFSFSNAYLQVLNEEIEEEKLNNYVRFITILYENNYEYFYSNDLKLLIDILLRELQMNRSELNQYLIVCLFSTLADKKWFREITHKQEQMLNLLNDIKAWASDTDCKYATEELLNKLKM